MFGSSANRAALKAEKDVARSSLQRRLQNRRKGRDVSGDTTETLVDPQIESSVNDLCDTLLDRDPNNLDALLAKATSLYAKGQFEESLKCYNKMMTLAPRDVNANLGRGRVLEALGQYAQASDVYQDILKADGSNVKACLGQGLFLINI